MKPRNIIYLCTAFFIGIIYAFSGKATQNKNLKSEQNDTTISNLALYGKYVFNRESCTDCHTLNKTDNKELLRLDGIKDGYDCLWLFRRLMDPESVRYNSGMPSFKQLNDNALSKEQFALIVKSDIEKNWADLNQEADTILNSIGKIEYNYPDVKLNPGTEIVALIAYLKTIEASEELRQLRAFRIAEEKREDIFWDSVVNNSSSFIYQSIYQKNSADTGKIIFTRNCFPCHGMNGEGVVGPNLTDEYWINGSGEKDIARVIVFGVLEKGMIAWRERITPNQIGQLIAFIKSIKGSHPKNAKEKQGIKSN